MTSIYSNGKLLLTGEYVVIDGAKALAFPTSFGQGLEINTLNEPVLIWESYLNDGSKWLQVEFDLPTLKIITATFDSNKEGGGDILAENLLHILLEAKKLNNFFLSKKQGLLVKSTLTFPINWGLGSSSTLINNIAQWAGVDAFKLLRKTFGGSGYDIACAQNNQAIIYSLKDHKPRVEKVHFDPVFKDQLYFVHLNKKQNSREGIAQYQKNKKDVDTCVKQISDLTNEIIICKDLICFEKIIIEHEQIISGIIKQKLVQVEFFSDYFGQTKSLGAWGGDFILATGNEDTPLYFKKKGFNTIISYEEMIL
ncbi:MAG: GYDIA family GHMP kinase [Flavobacteriaceae bacterium]|nr:GYDIA family GHMP kinase [Flavobacteriaceae bacterium]